MKSRKERTTALQSLLSVEVNESVIEHHRRIVEALEADLQKPEDQREYCYAGRYFTADEALQWHRDQLVNHVISQVTAE